MFFGDLPSSNTSFKSNLLSNLPSKGYLLEVEDSTTSGEFSKYLCLHNTAPEQEIKTDTTTMLIRSFSLKKRNRKKKRSSSSSASTKRGKKRKKASSSSSDSSIRFDGGKRKKSSQSNDKKTNRNRRLELACLRESLQRQGLDTVGTESELRLRLRQHHEESTEQQRVRLTAEPTTTNNASEREYWDIEF
eukprot:g6099.t1